MSQNRPENADRPVVEDTIVRRGRVRFGKAAVGVERVVRRETAAEVWQREAGEALGLARVGNVVSPSVLVDLLERAVGWVKD